MRAQRWQAKRLKLHCRAKVQQGAALLLAMLTVTLVASMAAAALWQQWRSVEVERAQRQRLQLGWVLTGALDWARLILQEDARTNRIDHLSEPWALALQEARLSSFLAADSNATDTTLEAFLSGQISDQQALLNINSLVQDGVPVAAAQRSFERLWERLNLPDAELALLVSQLVLLGKQAKAAAAPLAAASAANAAQPQVAFDLQVPLRPQRLEQLAWLGMSSSTLQALVPFVTLLPQATPVNLNTAAPEVLAAVLPGVDMAQARQLTARRATSHFGSVVDALSAAGLAQSKVDMAQLDVASRYFLVLGRLRLQDGGLEEQSLVEREGMRVRVVWRQRQPMAFLNSAVQP